MWLYFTTESLFLPRLNFTASSYIFFFFFKWRYFWQLWLYLKCSKFPLISVFFLVIVTVFYNYIFLLNFYFIFSNCDCEYNCGNFLIALLWDVFLIIAIITLHNYDYCNFISRIWILCLVVATLFRIVMSLNLTMWLYNTLYYYSEVERGRTMFCLTSDPVHSLVMSVSLRVCVFLFQRPRHAHALFDFTSNHATHLRFLRGDVIDLLDCSDAQCWRGRCRGRVGVFPPEYVQPIYHWTSCVLPSCTVKLIGWEPRCIDLSHILFINLKVN